MFGPLRSLAREPEGRVLLGTSLGTIAVGTGVYMFLEGWSPVDALYFSVVTLATVGFGDLAPTTNEAKLFTVAYIIFGVGILAAFVSELGKRRTERPERTPEAIEHSQGTVSEHPDQGLAGVAEGDSGNAGSDRGPGPTVI